MTADSMQKESDRVFSRTHVIRLKSRRTTFCGRRQTDQRAETTNPRTRNLGQFSDGSNYCGAPVHEYVSFMELRTRHHRKQMGGPVVRGGPDGRVPRCRIVASNRVEIVLVQVSRRVAGRRRHPVFYSFNFGLVPAAATAAWGGAERPKTLVTKSFPCCAIMGASRTQPREAPRANTSS
jgi:hypothetical protein